tara:strand:- start:343 stop:558 length:216 start_codon:yes stop_codon:yes gene_type:complete
MITLHVSILNLLLVYRESASGVRFAPGERHSVASIQSEIWPKPLEVTTSTTGAPTSSPYKKSPFLESPERK